MVAPKLQSPNSFRDALSGTPQDTSARRARKSPLTGRGGLSRPLTRKFGFPEFRGTYQIFWHDRAHRCETGTIPSRGKLSTRLASARRSGCPLRHTQIKSGQPGSTTTDMVLVEVSPHMPWKKELTAPALCTGLWSLSRAYVYLVHLPTLRRTCLEGFRRAPKAEEQKVRSKTLEGHTKFFGPRAFTWKGRHPGQKFGFVTALKTLT